MTIFSTGMQDMAKRMRRCGIESTSHPYHEWGQIAEELIRQPKHGRLILGGHSLGADASLKLAARLGEHQVEVAVVIMVDPYRPIDIPRNVATALNFYQSDGWSKPIPRENFTGLLLNVNVDGISESGELDHFSIDESADVHRLAIDVSLSAGATVPESERQRVARGNVDEGPSLSH